jgi:hypothetical protein
MEKNIKIYKIFKRRIIKTTKHSKKMFEKIIYSVIERFYESVNWTVKKPGNDAQIDLFDLLGME